MTGQGVVKDGLEKSHALRPNHGTAATHPLRLAVRFSTISKGIKLAEPQPVDTKIDNLW
jgi:hypothetical protein